MPEPIDDPSPADYLALVSRAIFQAGLSWALIAAKWPAYERLFAGFDPETVARFDDFDIDRIATDAGIVRTRKKVAATVENARALLALGAEYGSFRAYLRSFDSYAAASAGLRARFKFMGELSAYYVLFRAGEPVPRFEDWEQTVPGDHPRMREMIAAARERGRSSERPGMT